MSCGDNHLELFTNYIASYITFSHLDTMMLPSVAAGREPTPMAQSHEGGGRTVYEYEPNIGGFVSSHVVSLVVH